MFMNDEDFQSLHDDFLKVFYDYLQTSNNRLIKKRGINISLQTIGDREDWLLDVSYSILWREASYHFQTDLHQEYGTLSIAISGSLQINRTLVAGYLFLMAIYLEEGTYDVKKIPES